MRTSHCDRILRSVDGRRKRKEYNPIPLWIGLALVIAVLAAVLCINLGRAENPVPPEDTEVRIASITEESVAGETDVPGPYPGYTALSLGHEDIYRGDLILVNSAYPYVFPDDQDIVTFFGHKTDDYKLAEAGLRLDSFVLSVFNDMLADFASTMDRRDVIVNSGYRTLEEQQEIYDTRLAAYGENYVKAYVANPGYSEHHTGYALDMAVYTDEGVSLTFDKDEDFRWFYDASHTYGFVRRYAANKVDITGISNEPWHFRYVGKPHAYYMYTMDLCLEEYIDLLRNHPFGGEHLTFRDDEEMEWEIYYVPSEGALTTVYVPSERPYTVSGNNCDGYIITAKAKTADLG